MNNILELMGYEYKKIFRKKSTWITLGILLVLILFVGVENMIGNTYHEGMVIGTKYEETQKNKEAASKIFGRVFDKTLIFEAMDALNQYQSQGYSAYEIYRPYRPIIVLYSYAVMDNPSVLMIRTNLSEEEAENYYISMKANMKKIIDLNLFLTEKEKEKLKSYTEEIKTPFIYEYSDGYKKFAYSTKAIGLFLMLGIVYCMAPLFAGEYATKMDALILSSRFGKNKLITAKILTGLTFSLLITILGLVVSIVEIFCIYGIEGANMPIQVWGLVGVLMVYPIQCAAGMIIISLCLSLASLLMSGITMLLSAKLKSPYHVVILSSIIILVPLIFQVPRDLIIINFLYHLLPVNMMSYDRILSTYLYSVGEMSIKPFHFIPVYCMIGICVLSKFTYRGFKRHQIA